MAWQSTPLAVPLLVSALLCVGLGAFGSVPPWSFWLYVVCAWGLVSLAVVLVARGTIRARSLSRPQGVAIVAAAAGPWLGNILHVTGIVRFPANPMPFLFTLSGIVFFGVIFRLRLLDLVPVARETLLEEMPDGVVVMDESGRILDLNPAAQRLLGPGVVPGSLGTELPPPFRALAAVAPGTGPVSMRLDTGSGVELRSLDVRITPLHDRAGRSSGRLFVLRDLTESERREGALAVQRAYLEQLFDSAPQGLALLDEGDRVVDVNGAWQRLFGYPPEEARGQPINALIVPDHLQEEGEEITARVVTGAPAEFETVRRRRDGGLVDVHVTGTPVFVGGRQVGIWGMYADISERKSQERLRAELLDRERSLRGEAESAVRARDSVLGVVSHDLRNPLTAILLQADAILIDALPHRTREGIEEIVRSAERMERMIRDLLDVAAIEAGRLRLDPERIPAGGLLREAGAMLAPLAEESGVTLEVDAAPVEGEEVLADRDRVLQVLSNLVGNALRYTPAGGRVTLSAEADGDDVRFRVADSGSGIAEPDLPRVWERFWQGEGARNHGVGLGLPIARGIVEAHGGRIWVETAGTGGAVFGFSLPSPRVAVGLLSSRGRGVAEG